jgi:hypothetical protein
LLLQVLFPSCRHKHSMYRYVYPAGDGRDTPFLTAPTESSTGQHAHCGGGARPPVMRTDSVASLPFHSVKRPRFRYVSQDVDHVPSCVLNHTVVRLHSILRTGEIVLWLFTFRQPAISRTRLGAPATGAPRQGKGRRALAPARDGGRTQRTGRMPTSATVRGAATAVKC